MVKNLSAMQKTHVQFFGWKDPGRGNGDPVQYSCLEDSMGRGAWQVIVHRVSKSQTLTLTKFSRASQVAQ